MLSFAAAVATKDLRLAFKGPGGLCQAILFGLLLIFIFSLAAPPGEQASPETAAAIFWLGSAFCQVLIFNQLYAGEEANLTRQCLILAPAPIQGVWFGKALAGLVLLITAQAILLPAMAIFLSQQPTQSLWPLAAAILVVDPGMAALGSLLGGLTQGQTGRESLLSIILFPLLVPLLLAAISLTAQTLGGLPSAETGSWLGIALAFDAIFLACGLALFGFLYQGDE